MINSLSTARGRAKKLAPLLDDSGDAGGPPRVDEHQAAEITGRALRVREHLLAFAREHHLVAHIQHRLKLATRDERSWLERVVDSLRMSLFDSRPWTRRQNPDVGQEEAQEILDDLRQLPPTARIRAANYLLEGLPATIQLAHGNEQAVLRQFRQFARETLDGQPESDRARLREQSRHEADFLRQVDRGRDPTSEAGEALSEHEMRALLRIIDRMESRRAVLFRDALAAICLTPVAFAPEAATQNATRPAQEVLADAFWAAETDRETP